MSGHDHDDHHHHEHEYSELSETQLRVRALETVLTEKGYVDPAALDLLIETYEKKVGPRNGARSVASAWSTANLVQIGPISLARSCRSARCPRRFWRHVAEGYRNPHLGLDRR